MGEYTNYRTRGAWRLFGHGQPEGTRSAGATSVHRCRRAGEHLKDEEVPAMRSVTWG